MAKQKTETKEKEKAVVKTGKTSCADKLCPFHGIEPVKLRGRIFEGEIIKKFPGRVVIQFERMLYVPKYERYEKRKTKLHARLPDCLKDTMQVGDYIKIAECRPLSKIIHCIATEKIRSKGGKLT
ncbi:MAG: 30S ribosomal protein S17 [Nanoarchaeota archaeon]|nr:30S ribosomal protein S17 [Nanoarchaeota archaeon]